MRREWEAWLSKRATDARADFQKLLEENSFVEFWGKVGKLEDANQDDRRLVVPGEEDLQMNQMGGGPAGVAADDGSEGKADLKTLAKNINEKEIEWVLQVCRSAMLVVYMYSEGFLYIQNDQRYRAFDHVPGERVRWVKVKPALVSLLENSSIILSGLFILALRARPFSACPAALARRL
jgi:hypothetical protein